MVTEPMATPSPAPMPPYSAPATPVMSSKARTTVRPFRTATVSWRVRTMPPCPDRAALVVIVSVRPTAFTAMRSPSDRWAMSAISSNASMDNSPSSTHSNSIFVWARAAELQAHTGMMVPPASLSASADSSVADAPSPTRGYDMDVVRHAAAEAGIAAKYVERALAERRQSTAVSKVEVTPGTRMQRAPNAFLGAHTKIEFECVLDGELSIDAFEEIADIAQRSLGDLIAVSAVGRTLTMTTSAARAAQGGMVRTLQLTVAVRNGRTVVRAFEDITGVAGGLYGGMGAGLGVAIGSVTMAVLSKSAGGIVGLGALLGVLAGALAGARYAFTTASANKQKELRGLVEELARFAAAQLHRTARTLGSGTHPTSGDR